MPAPLSKHSIGYRDMSEEEARRIVASMQQRKIEDFRLRLDVEHILPLIKGPDVLDMPLGVGRFTPFLIGRFNNYGYEISPHYIEFARKTYPQIADHFAVCSFEEINKDKLFDTVITLRILSSLKSLEIAMENVAVILKPNGRWIFNYPRERARFDELETLLLAAGMTLTHKQRYDFHASMASMNKYEQKIYDRFRAVIERGWVPYWLYRLVEFLYVGRGTYLFVAEKTGR